jgi:xylose dehydrogenase (NAD/NADP)
MFCHPRNGKEEPMEKKLHWGIMGTALIATGSVIPAIQASETGIVTAIASRDIQKARETANRFGIQNSYGSYEKLLSDPEIDAIYIPLPNHMHKEWTIRAAEAGKHILCEKPLALSVDEAKQMVEACRKSGVLLAEAFMYRHHPRYEMIKNIIRSGEIGKVRAIHGNFTYNNEEDKTNIRFRKDWGGGGIYDVGIYPISAARLILETEPEAVTVHAQSSAEYDNVDMMASGLVEFPGGIGLTFDCGMWALYRNSLEILGSLGRIEVPEAFKGKSHFFVTTSEGRREVQPTELDAYGLEADDLARAVWGEKRMRFEPEDAVRNMRVLESCLKSAKERIRVPL